MSVLSNALDTLGDAIGTAIARGLKDGTTSRNDKLREAAPELVTTLEYVQREMQCSCTLAQRTSGHLSDCWYPTVAYHIAEVLQKAGRGR